MERVSATGAEADAAEPTAVAPAPGPTAVPQPVPTALLVLGLGAGVAFLIGIALVTGFFSAPSAPANQPATTIATTVPPTPVATTHVVTRTNATALTFEGTTGWLADGDAATVHRFDPSSGTITGTATGVGQRPVAVTSGAGRIWVADSVGSVVIALDPTNGRVRGRPITVAQEPVTLDSGPGGIWVGSVLGGTVSVLDPRSGAVRASVAIPDGVSRLVTGDGAVWVAGQQSSLTRVDPRPVGLVLRWRSVTVGRGPIDVALGAGSVWVANAQSASITRVNPSTMRVTGTWRLPDGHGGAIEPAAIAFFAGRLWVADGIHDTVTAIDPATGREVGRAVSLPGPFRQLAAGDGALWAATSFPGAVVRIDPN
jgi:streptogramin lyase